MLTRYQSSGRVGAATALAVFPISAALLVLGAVYQVLMHYVPLIIIDLFIALMFAAAVLLVVGKVQKWCHCRHAGVGALVGLVSGAICVLATHYFSLCLYSKGLADPSDLAEFLRFRTTTGWSIGRLTSSGAPVTGWAVWAVWAIEALIIVGAAALGGIGSASEPYCEKCGAWADRIRASVKVREPAAPYVERVTKATEFKELGAKDKGGEPGSMLEYTVRECPVCKGVPTLTVSYECEKPDKSGKKTEREKKDIHSNIVLTDAEAEKLLTLDRTAKVGVS